MNFVDVVVLCFIPEFHNKTGGIVNPNGQGEHKNEPWVLKIFICCLPHLFGNTSQLKLVYCVNRD